MDVETGRRWPVESLQEFATAAFQALGVPGPDAATAAEVLVAADLHGVTTHGVLRLPNYICRLQAGSARPAPVLRVLRESPLITVLDGDDGLGLVQAAQGMDLAIARARQHGIGIVTIRHSGHLGAAGVQALRAVAAGYIGLAITTGAALLPAWGGAEPVLGTNAWSLAAPAGEEPPLVLDMCQAVAAVGKIRAAARAGRALPPGWALDRNGLPTTDPAAALSGLLLPFGGHKGYGLTVVMGVLAGLLAGTDPVSPLVDAERWDLPDRKSHFCLALDPAHFVPPAAFRQRVDAFSQALRQSRLARGFDRILTPGERAHAALQENARRGVPLTAPVADTLAALGQELRVSFPPPLAG